MSDATATDVVVLSAVRTAIGTFGGSLKDKTPSELGTAVIAESLQRAEVEAGAVQHVVMGNVINTEARDMYLSRVAALDAGVPQETPCLTVNRLCGSGLQAIVSAAQSIMLGDAEIAVAGGAECMSRAPYHVPAMRFGQKMGDAGVTDMLIGALSDPFGHGHMGITAENVAERWQVSRGDQDGFALESQQRAAKAQGEGRFKTQILPIAVQQRRETISFDQDEHLKPNTTAEDLAKLRPAFKKDGSVTAGNASGINDGAAALTLMHGEAADKRGLKPMARLLGYAHAGVEPEVMGIGPVPAVQRLLDRIGLTIADFDVIESNEAFASQACAVARQLGFPAEKTNPNGGAIALGHPVGATGAIITTKALYELVRTGGKRALVTMCIGGGQGIAAAFERLDG